MNPVNGPVVVGLLIVVVVLSFVVGAQRSALLRSREALRRQRSRTRVLRQKLDAAEAADVPVPLWPAESWAERHPATRARLRSVGGEGA